MNVMVTQELIAYIQQELAIGETIEALKLKLIASGWNEIDIETAITTAIHPEAKQHVKPASLFSKFHSEFTSLFNQAWLEFTSHWKKYVLVQIIVLSVWLFAFILIFLIYILLIKLGFYNSNLSSKIVFYTVSLVFFIYPSIVSAYMIYSAVLDEENKRKIGDYFKDTIKYGLKLWLLYIIMSIAIVGPSLLIVFLAVGLNIFVFSKFGDSNLINAVTLMIALIIGLILALIALSWYIFSPYIYITEKTKLIEALRRSKYYVRSHEVRVLFHILVIIIFGIVFNLIPIVGSLIQFLTLTISTIYLYKVYKNLRLEASFDQQS